MAAVSFLLDNGADVDSRDAEGCTALHWAADRGSLEVGPQYCLDNVALFVSGGVIVCVLEMCMHLHVAWTC